MNEFVDDRPTATYCYAIHRDTEHDHVQVAMTGEKCDLYADKEERKQMRTNARQQFRERQHGRARRGARRLWPWRFDEFLGMVRRAAETALAVRRAVPASKPPDDRFRR